MAFDKTGLIAFAHGTGERLLHHYTTADLLTVVDDAGYFNAAASALHVGDVILVSADVEGTPGVGIAIVTALAPNVTTVWFDDNATINLVQPIRLPVSMPAIGTAETVYVHAGVPDGFVGTITRVTGVCDTNGAGSGGTSTLTVSVPTTGAIATLPFAEDYTAGALIEDTTITAHVALDDDAVITIATDGTGSHAGAAIISIEVSLARAP